MNKPMKRIVCLLVTALLTFSMCALCSQAEDGTEISIKIVHTNDIHARVEENAKSAIIGFARLASFKTAFTAGADLALTLDSGDMLHGQPIATLEKGAPIAELASAVGYDAFTAGNHDWNYGKEALRDLSAATGAVMLTGNVKNADGTRFFEEEFLIRTVEKDGKTLKIGVFGVIDPKVTEIIAPALIEGLTFEDASSYANSAAAALREMGCGAVIALAHTFDPVGLAKSVEGVDLWLTGHEHVQISEQVTTNGGAKTYVLEGRYYLYALSAIELNVTLGADGSVAGVNVSAQTLGYSDLTDYTPDAGIESQLESIKARQADVLGVKVGQSPVDLDGVWEHLRTGQTNLGKAVCQAYLLETGADVAFENAGGIRSSIAAGDVTYADVLGVSPYGNIVVTKKITGAQLREILETVLQIEEKCIAADLSGEYTAWPANSGSYLQCAGIRLVYDPEKPAGERILSLYVGGRECESDMEYIVVSNNYLMNSSTDFPALANAAEIAEFRACEEVLADYFAQGAQVVGASLEGADFVTAQQIDAGAQNLSLWVLLSFVSLALAAAAICKKRRAL